MLRVREFHLGSIRGLFHISARMTMALKAKALLRTVTSVALPHKNSFSMLWEEEKDLLIPQSRLQKQDTSKEG